jgi:hypothetical protein
MRQFGNNKNREPHEPKRKIEKERGLPCTMGITNAHGKDQRAGALHFSLPAPYPRAI